MKNLKKLLILGVMIVNLMPYLKDGKVELKSAEVTAQQYVCEGYVENEGFLCVNVINNDDYFYEDTEDDNCDPSKINDYCKPKVIDLENFSKISPDNKDTELQWCGFVCFATITETNVCDAVNSYNKYYNNGNSSCDPGIGITPNTLIDFYTMFGVNATGLNTYTCGGPIVTFGNYINDLCGLTTALRNKKGVLTGNGSTHVALYIGIENKTGLFTPLKFIKVDTQDSDWWTYDLVSEIDYNSPMVEVSH
jgi:hypothetical protein